MDNEKTPPLPAEPWHRSRMLLRNSISLAGIALAIVSLANIFLFVIIDAIAVKPSPYIGILAYMVSPAFLILGLLLMLGGELVERRKKVAPTAFYPRIDLNDPVPAQRRHLVRDVPDRVRHGEHSGQLQSLRIHRIGLVLRPVVPHRDESGIHRLPAFSACPRGLRGMPRGRGCNLVCEVQAFRQPAGFCRRYSILSRGPFRRRCTTCAPRRKPASSVTGRRNSMAGNSKSSPTTPTMKRTPCARSA